MSLSDLKIKNAKPSKEGKIIKLNDGNGLVLAISPKGTKTWKFRYSFSGKQKDYTMGQYPEMPLSSYIHNELGEIRGARQFRDDLKLKLSQGIDIAKLKKDKKLSNNDFSNAFENVANEWAIKRREEISPITVKGQMQRLALYVFPYIGKLKIDEIDSADILRTLKIVEGRGIYETVQRLRTSIGQVFDFGIAMTYCKNNPTYAIRTGLIKPKKKHFASISNKKRVGQVLRMFDAYRGTPEVECLMKLQPHLPVRPSELREMKWVDLDLEKKEWRFVSSKRKIDLIVPLSNQVMELIREIQPLSRYSEYVIPSPKGRRGPLSSNALLVGYKAMGIPSTELVPHGWRSTFQTLCMEDSDYSELITDLQLSHAPKNPNGTAYNRTQFLDKRKVMMQDWSDFLEKLKGDM